ncbi:MAG: NlpC/P60 family protein [Actinomycetota bacterium]|nr:NlpC/P60 family protein [Actinomycetota bacterium]
MRLQHSPADVQVHSNVRAVPTTRSQVPVTTDTSTRRAFLRAAGTATVGLLGVLALPGTSAFADHRTTTGDQLNDPIAELASSAVLELRHGAMADSKAYRSLRDQVATAAAGRVGIDPTALARAWATADLEHQMAVLTGLTQLGVPYRRNTSRPGYGFDCSGLTTYAWAGAGYTLTRQSTAQIRKAAPRKFETAQAGDLVQYPGHIMMWLGVERAVLQSPRTGRTVEIVRYKQGRTVKVGDPTG